MNLKDKNIISEGKIMKRLINKTSAILDMRNKPLGDNVLVVGPEKNPKVIDMTNKGLAPNVIDLRGVNKIEQFDTLEDYYSEMGWTNGPSK